MNKRQGLVCEGKMLVCLFMRKNRVMSSSGACELFEGLASVLIEGLSIENWISPLFPGLIFSPHMSGKGALQTCVQLT